MSLKLKHVKRVENGLSSIVYELSHSNTQTILNLDVDVSIDCRYSDAPKVTASMKIEGKPSKDVGGALEYLADWLERSAMAIRSRDTLKALSLPMYDEVPTSARTIKEDTFAPSSIETR